MIDLKMTFMDSEHLYFVFEHCKYGTLSNMITQKGKLEPNVAVNFAASIVEGLQQIFDNKIMHRDLKPENILIDENKQLKIIDFGDAKIFEDDVYDYSFEYRPRNLAASAVEESKVEEAKTAPVQAPVIQPAEKIDG